MEFPVYYYLLMHSNYLYVDKTHACLISTDIFINHRSVNSCKYKCKRGRKGGVKGNLNLLTTNSVPDTVLGTFAHFI